MALIHEKLYRTEGLAQIDFKDYLTSLTDMLLHAESRGQNPLGISTRTGRTEH